ncbi:MULTISPECIES: DUF6673 family protein [Clostridium]|jgi:hypothetical protein|uniref:DUF6673 family protein n=1 Tax=Clostridium TaxID=1485 RepID=UPI0024B3285C|nr:MULTISPECIES: DUF6673 family protein [Clostridium]MDI9215944.1 AP endonuclease [Clostridium tertium]
MIINGVELEDIDFYDLEVAEKYDKSLERIKSIEENNKNVSMVEMIKINCNAIFDVFNLMFGEGTDKKVFGDRVNLLICMTAFEELVSQMNDKKAEMEKITNKYSPNRANRRTKK